MDYSPVCQISWIVDTRVGRYIFEFHTGISNLNVEVLEFVDIQAKPARSNISRFLLRNT